MHVFDRLAFSSSQLRVAVAVSPGYPTDNISVTLQALLPLMHVTYSNTYTQLPGLGTKRDRPVDHPTDN